MCFLRKIRQICDHQTNCICELDCSQEEVVISFGLDKTWDGSKGQREIDIGHRIVLSPFAAKRLAQMMQEFVQSYEKKYGALAMK
jgi:Protein of unknown function (DUF3467)